MGTTPPVTDSPIHATVVARYHAAGWRGVLISGGSGAGKSDLALRLIGRGWRLIADDYAWVWASGGALYASAPDAIAGLIEARGVGISSAPSIPSVRIVLAVAGLDHEPERLPAATMRTLAGIAVPEVALNPLHASAPLKVEAALKAVLA